MANTEHEKDSNNITIEELLGNYINDDNHEKEVPEKPRNYFIASALSILLCGSLIGFIALWHSIKVIRLWKKERYVEAKHLSRTTKYWCVLSYVMPILTAIFIVAFTLIATPIVLPLIASFLSLVGGGLSLLAPILTYFILTNYA